MTFCLSFKPLKLGSRLPLTTFSKKTKQITYLGYLMIKLPISIQICKYDYKTIPS